MRPVTPRGFRDVLPQEAAERAALSSTMMETFAAWGYGPVETPVAEEYETLEAGAGRALGGDTFRLFDLDGSLLALRPEMTVPIARLVASRMAAEEAPYRLAYAAPVFREHASLRGETRQFSQVGVEMIGADGPASDAEVIAVLIEGLRACGLDEAVVSLGTVEVLKGIIAASGMPKDWGEDVLRAAHDRNMVALDQLAGSARSRDVRDALRTVPRIRGGVEAIETCREAAGRLFFCDPLLDAMTETWRLLEATGVSEAVAIDFGIMRSFDYYSGLILEVHVPGLGLPLGGGGRYDGLLAEFGAPAPAAGFALTLERVHIALAERDRSPEVPQLDAVLGGDRAQDVFAAAADMRVQGSRVRIAPDVSRERVLAEAATARAGQALWVADGVVYSLVPVGEAAR